MIIRYYRSLIIPPHEKKSESEFLRQTENDNALVTSSTWIWSTLMLVHREFRRTTQVVLWTARNILHRILYINYECKTQTRAVADLRGARGTHAPSPGSKFFQLHAVFKKIWQNRMLAPPGSWRPLLGEILDPPLMGHPPLSKFQWRIQDFPEETHYFSES